MINRQGLGGDYYARPIPLFPTVNSGCRQAPSCHPSLNLRKANAQLGSSKDLVTLDKEEGGSTCSHVNAFLSPVGVLKTFFPLSSAPLRVSQHIVTLTTELPHRFFTRFLSAATASKSFFRLFFY